MYQREMVLHTCRDRPLRSWLARRFLGRAGYRFEEVVDATEGPWTPTRRGSGPPYVFVDRRPVGGMGTVRALAGSGGLEHLLRDDL
ncbi:MAG TPA: hypothetical protein VGV91_05430 [Rubrobacter sp.]|nr:hypothetical protein [Rubrobacter sp.]